MSETCVVMPKRQPSSSTCAVATNHDPVIDPSALSTAIAEAFKTQAVLDVIIPALSDAISENIHRAVELEFVKRDEKISNLEKEVGHLVRQLEQQEQYLRRNCLIVHGIPEVATSHQPENTDNKVIEVAQQYLDLVIPKESIDRTHRIGSRLDKSGNPRTRPIIVNFLTIMFVLHFIIYDPNSRELIFMFMKV